MRKSSTLRILVLMLALILTVAPLTAHAAWDRLENNDNDAATSSSSSSSTSSSKYPYSNLKSKIEEHKKTNKDVVGWLKIPNTNIDIPIVQNTNNNNYYVARDWKGTNYPNNSYTNQYETATYLDYRVKLGETWKNGNSKNMVIYGHNWNNLREPFVIGNQAGDKKMFDQLPSYTDLDFAKNNGHIYFSTGENEGVWRVFAVAYCELSTDFFYNSPNPSQENYEKILSEWKQRTIHNFDVEVDTSDRILTLSTCTRNFNAGNQQRFVVVARLLRNGESESDTVKVTKNDNPKMPKW